MHMADLNELEQTVANLSSDDHEEFRNWFDNYEADHWDAQFQEDVKAGRLDAVAAEAVRQYKSGTCTDL